MTEIDVPRRSRAWIGWVIVLVVVGLLLCTGWLVVRGIGAGVALASAGADSRALKDAVRAGDLPSAEVIARRMSADTANAQSLTSDPIWRAAEWLPAIGPNMTAIREVSALTHSLTGDAAPAMLDAAHVMDLGTLGISEGRIELAPLAAAAPDLAVAAEHLADADTAVRAIDLGATLPPIRDAIADLAEEIGDVARATAMLDGAARLLPTMLGGEEPRTYLLLMQNNAELRSSGGIPGAMALVHAQGGAVTLGVQADTSQFRRLDPPVAELPESVRTLFGDSPAERIQDTTSPPDFPLGAELAAGVWERTMGGTVHGVIAVDAVLVGRLLEATGPLTVAGVELDASNAADLLLGDVYRRLPDPAAQNEFFRETTSTLFRALTDGSTGPSEMLEAFADAGESGRLRVWSSDEAEQAVILDTTLSGVLPADRDSEVTVGVLANDTTGGKMDYFADAAVATRLATCSGTTRLDVTVDWTSNAPADAATSLPDYVTAAGWFDVPPGITGTRLAVVGPEGWSVASEGADGDVTASVDTSMGDRAIVQYELRTPPGGTQTVSVTFVAPAATDPVVRVHSTPMIRDVPVESVSGTC